MVSQKRVTENGIFPKNRFFNFPKSISGTPIFDLFWERIWECSKIKGFRHSVFRKIPKNISPNCILKNYYVMGQTSSSSKKANLAFSHFFNSHQFFFTVFEKLNKICFLMKCDKSHKIKVFALFSATKKTLWICIATDLQGQFLRWDNY